MDQLLYGSNSEENIIAVHPASDHSVRMYIKSHDKITTSEVEFYPFFYLVSPKYLKDYPKKHWIKELNGDNYFRYLCAFTSWLEMWDAIRFVLDRYNENAPSKVYSYTDLPILHVRTDPIAQFLKETGRTLFKGMKFEDLYRLQFDIETLTKRGFKFSNPHRLEDKIVVIALTDNRGWEHIIHAKRKSEKELLQEFVYLIREKDPDVIEGHNIFGFDLPYILTRCEMMSVDMAIGRDGSTPHPVDTRLSYAERSLGYTPYEIAGRHIIDTLLLLQSYDTAKRSLENYSLKNAAKHFGFTKKERVYIQPDRITWHWENEPDKLMHYCLDDARETGILSDHLSPCVFLLTQMLPFNYSSVERLGTSAKIESLLLREYIRQKHSIPKPEIGTQTLGGYTDIFHTGVLGPVVDVDVESLYPSIMLNEKITPKTEKLGIFLSLLDELTKIRLDAKRKMEAAINQNEYLKFENLQHTFKTLINSFYGYLGYSKALFNDYKAADSVAQAGQIILGELISRITESEGKVIEVDTDGVYFVPPKTVLNEKDEVDLIEAFAAQFPSGIKLQINGRYKRMLSYKKKNYALLGYDGRVIVKGSSLISRTMEKYGRDFIKLCIEALLNNDFDKVHDSFVSYHKSIDGHRLSVKDFARTETLRDSYDDYINEVKEGKRNRSACYEVAIQSGMSWKVGDKVSYYFTGAETGVKGFENCKLADEWDPNFPDENVPYYLKRLDEYAKKFEDFFSEKDFHAIFSIDDLFGFSSQGMQILTKSVKLEAREAPEEETESIHVEPKIWLDEDML